jgi:hypothetical protein
MLGLRTAVPLLATAILLVVPAEATTSYYQGSTGETAFNAAIGGLTLMDPSLTFSAGDLGSGGLFNADGTGINILGFDSLNNSANFTVASGTLKATQVSEKATVNFPAGAVYAFGFDLTDTSSFAFWCVELTQGTCDYQLTNTSPSNVQFFGFVSSAPVTAPLYIRPQSGNPTMVITNFEAYSDPVPEPRTMLLVGIGLATLGLARSKRAAALFR